LEAYQSSCRSIAGRSETGSPKPSRMRSKRSSYCAGARGAERSSLALREGATAGCSGRICGAADTMAFVAAGLGRGRRVAHAASIESSKAKSARQIARDGLMAAFFVNSLASSPAQRPRDAPTRSVAAVDDRLVSHARVSLPQPGDDAGDGRELKSGRGTDVIPPDADGISAERIDGIESLLVGVIITDEYRHPPGEGSLAHEGLEGRSDRATGRNQLVDALAGAQLVVRREHRCRRLHRLPDLALQVG